MVQVKHWLGAVTFAAMVLPSFAATAQIATPWNDHPNSKVRLIAGEGRMLGVEVQLAPGWKTYWRMPGDAGVPPNFDWTGSQNVKAIDVLYPAPISMPDQGGVAVGYKGAVTFPVKLTLADDAKPATIALEFAFGVCKDICIPVESKFSLALPASAAWPAYADLKAHAASVPRVVTDATQGSPALAKFSGDVTGAKPHLTFETRRASEVYIEAPDSLFVPLAIKTKTAGDAATFVVDLSKSPDAKDLAGKPLRITVVGPDGAIDTSVVAK